MGRNNLVYNIREPNKAAPPTDLSYPLLAQPPYLLPTSSERDKKTSNPLLTSALDVALLLQVPFCPGTDSSNGWPMNKARSYNYSKRRISTHARQAFYCLVGLKDLAV